jgi:hypothetical protein
MRNGEALVVVAIPHEIFWLEAGFYLYEYIQEHKGEKS